MPEAIVVALVALAPEGVGTVTIAGLSVATATTVISVATYSSMLVGSTLLARALTPTQTTSTIQQQVAVRQALPSRFRSYGRCKVAGVIGFEAVDGGGDLWIVQLLGNGEIDAIEEHWFGDDQMPLNPATGAIGTTYGGGPGGGGDYGIPEHPYGGVSSIFTQSPSTLGNADQVANVLQGYFVGDWTVNDRWRGVPYATLLFIRPANQTIAAAYFPYGPPNYRAVLRGAKIYDPRVAGQMANGDPDRPDNNNWTWSQNAALVILDFLRHPDGWAKAALGGTRSMTPISLFNVPSFIAFANLSDTQVLIANGGGATVAQYLLAGSYDMGTTAPKTVLEGMLASCDGEIYRDGNGLIAIRGGQFGPDPDVTLDSTDIIEYDLRPGASVFSAVNWMNAKFCWARSDYNLTDMWPWIDQANINLRGELLTETLDLSWCPTNSQARRIAKITMGKRNPQWAGTVVTGPRGLLAFGERLIALNIPELNIDPSIAFLVTAFEPSPTLEKIKLTIAALDPSAYEWDAATEEGVLPSIGSALPDAAIPAMVPWPTPATGGLLNTVNVVFSRSSGVTVISWANVSFITLFYECQYADDSGNWIDVPVPDADGVSLLSVTINLDPTQTYAFQVRSVTPAGKASQWSPGIVTYLGDPWSAGFSAGFGPWS